MKLKGSVIKIDGLQNSEIMFMFDLMSRYYGNTTRKKFESDLEEKEWAVLIKDSSNTVRGFTTIRTMDFDINGEIVHGIFSGDTIIQKEFWGDLVFPKTWIRFVLSLVHERSINRLYWFLISKGYKTYRYLSVCFKAFYPSYDIITPSREKILMDTFGTNRYSSRYNPLTGVIGRNIDSDFLKDGIADIGQRELSNPHIRFFAEKNPDYAKGDEMVCLADLSVENLKPGVRKLFVGD